MRRFILFTLFALFTVVNVNAQNKITLSTSQVYAVVNGSGGVQDTEYIKYFFIITDSNVYVYDASYNLNIEFKVAEVKKLSDSEYHFHIESDGSKWTTEVVVDTKKDMIYVKKDSIMVVFTGIEILD